LNVEEGLITSLVLSSSVLKYPFRSTLVPCMELISSIILFSKSYSERSSSINFDNIDAGKYFIRIIFDENKNKKYDTGNFLMKIKPEKVLYFPDELDVRAGWDLVQEFILQ